QRTLSLLPHNGPQAAAAKVGAGHRDEAPGAVGAVSTHLGFHRLLPGGSVRVGHGAAIVRRFHLGLGDSGNTLRGSEGGCRAAVGCIHPRLLLFLPLCECVCLCVSLVLCLSCCHLTIVDRLL